MRSKKNAYGQWSKEALIARLEELETKHEHGLVWDEDKHPEEFETRAARSTPVLIHAPSHSLHLNPAKPTHWLIEGDNLHALSVLTLTHKNAVDLIYIDPPYNRGVKEANDSRYNDKYIHPDDSFRHGKWLTFIAKRLRLAKELLKESGVIFISIDDNELAPLKLLMDQIFGDDAYKNTIILKRGAKNVQAQFETIDKLASGYEYVLFYAHNPKQRFQKMVKTLDQAKPGGWNNHWRGTNRPTMRYELFGITPKTGQWRWGKERSLSAAKNYTRMLKELGLKPGSASQAQIDAWYTATSAALGKEIDLLRISSTGKPEHYIPPTDVTLLNDVWFDISPNSSSILKSIFGQKVFDNPKPLELIKRIAKFAGKDAVILDFFAGSGTSAHAILELNAEDQGRRQVFLVTNNENKICTEVCYPRIKKIIKGYTNSKGITVKGFGENLQYFKTGFLRKNEKTLFELCAQFLCLKHGLFDVMQEKKEGPKTVWRIYGSSEQYMAIHLGGSEKSVNTLQAALKLQRRPGLVYSFDPIPGMVTQNIPAELWAYCQQASALPKKRKETKT